MCVELKQNYKCNCLQKCWKLSLLPKLRGLPKSGALGLILFSLMVNRRLVYRMKFRMLEVHENEIALRKLSAGIAQLRTLEGTLLTSLACWAH